MPPCPCNSCFCKVPPFEHTLCSAYSQQAVTSCRVPFQGSVPCCCLAGCPLSWLSLLSVFSSPLELCATASVGVDADGALGSWLISSSPMDGLMGLVGASGFDDRIWEGFEKMEGDGGDRKLGLCL